MKIGMIFPGYGSQFVGMAKELYDESRLLQEYFEEASNCLNSNFVKLCFASSDAELCRLENAYPALFLVSTSLAALLKQEGIEAHVVAGHSIGEFSAMHHAGGLSFPDGLYVLSKYALLYQDFLQQRAVGGLQVTGLDMATLAALCKQASDSDHSVTIGMRVSENYHCVMGHEPALDTLRTLLAEYTVTLDDVPSELGLHSPLMDPVVANLTLYLEKVDFKTMGTPLVSSTDGRIITHGDEGRAAVIKHIHAPLDWHTTVSQFADCDIIVAVGPGASLSAGVAGQFPEKQYITINKRSDIEGLKTLLVKSNETTEIK